jgi:uncharacterized membrane protein
MKNLTADKQTTRNLEELKRLATVVYICQAAAFALAGAPLIVGVVLNLMNRNSVEGTWLQSHFDWQIKTVWMTLAGFALAGLTFSVGVGLYILIPTIVVLVYRVYVGWTALSVNAPISARN